MNKRERFLVFANFEKIDRVPCYAKYVPALRQKMTAHQGKSPDEFFEMDVPGGASLRPPADFKFPDYRGYFPEYEGKNRTAKTCLSFPPGFCTLPIIKDHSRGVL